MYKKMMIKNLARRGMLMLLVMAAMVSLLIPQASAASVPGVSSSSYFACYTASASGRVYAYTDSTLKTKTGGWIDCATDECWITAITPNAIQASYPVSSGGRRIAWFPRSAFTAFDLTATGFTAVTASGKVTTYVRSSGGTTYGYVAKGDRVVILGASGSRTQLLYPVGSHYKMAWAETSQVSKYLTGGSSGAVTFNGTYTLYTALGNNLVLDVCGNSCDNGANIQIYSANGTSAQIFQIIPVSGEWCKIVHTHSGKVVDVSGGSAASQTNCQLWEDNGSDAQRWRFIPFGSGYLIQSKLGCYLDVSGGNAVSGNNVWLFTGNQTASQIWVLKKLSGSGSSGSSAASNPSYAAYNGVNYWSLTSDARRIAACDKAVQMATVLWTTPCSFPTWKSSGGSYNTVTATDGTSSRQFLAGKTYQGIPYSMAGRTYDDTKWLKLVQSGLTTSLMTGKYYTSKADTTAKGIDCSYLVCTALNAGCGTSINLNTSGMLSSSKFQKISLSQMLPGDIFLKNGHVMFFMGKTGGKYAVIEANASYSRVVYRELSASGVSGYGSYRYTGF